MPNTVSHRLASVIHTEAGNPDLTGRSCPWGGVNNIESMGVNALFLRKFRSTWGERKVVSGGMIARLQSNLEIDKVTLPVAEVYLGRSHLCVFMPPWEKPNNSITLYIRELNGCLAVLYRPLEYDH